MYKKGTFHHKKGHFWSFDWARALRFLRPWLVGETWGPLVAGTWGPFVGGTWVYRYSVCRWDAGRGTWGVLAGGSWGPLSSRWDLDIIIRWDLGTISRWDLGTVSRWDLIGNC